MNKEANNIELINNDKFVSELETASMINIDFLKMEPLRNDIDNGAVINYDGLNKMQYGINSLGLYWEEIDINRYRYSLLSIRRYIENAKRQYVAE